MKKAIVKVLIIIAAPLFISFPTMYLWNWLMPDLFALEEIDYWQTLGLLYLSGIFFKSHKFQENGNFKRKT
jgi:hypothetical protein